MQAILDAKQLHLPSRLDNLSLQVGDGEVLGLLGTNGAGKSSVLAALAGVLPLTSGEVRFDGKRLADHPRLRREIGWLPQRVPLYEDMTVLENLRFAAGLYGCGSADVSRSMHDFALSPLQRRLVRRLSGGERMRLGLACCLVHRPRILLLDEPSAGLDALQSARLRNLIGELAQHHTVVIATHLPADVDTLCQRVVLLHAGRLVADEPVTTGRRRMLAHFTRVPDNNTLLGIAGIAAVQTQQGNQVIFELEPEASPSLAEALCGQGWGLQRWQPAEAEWRKRFLALSDGDPGGEH